MRCRTFLIAPLLALAPILAAPLVLMAGVLLLPTLLAWAGDTNSGKPATRAVLLFGLAAASPSLLALWSTGMRLTDAVAMTLDIRTLAWCWAAQAGAWLLAQSIPLAVAAARSRQAEQRAAMLERRQEALGSEWI